jgi:thioredoxin-related protein
MKKIMIISLLAILFTYPVTGKGQSAAKASIPWLTVEKAAGMNVHKHKKILIDVYTSWCSWCKKMDGETFSDPTVVAYINEHFYAVKLNAEEKLPIKFENKVYMNPDPERMRSVHELAAQMLQGRMGYPSYVFLDGKNQQITVSQGYNNASEFLVILKYIAEDNYKKMSLQEYKIKPAS